MQDKPKRRSRSATVSAPESVPDTNPRKTRSRKQIASPVEVMPVNVPDIERLGATVPLPPLPFKTGTNPLDNGGITNPHVQDSTVLMPRRIVCQQAEVAYLSDVGRVRNNNEDSASAFLSTVTRMDSDTEIMFGFLALADGMGGHERGEVASNLAIRKMNEGVIHYFYIPTMEGRPPGRPGESPLDVLRDLVLDTNQTILQAAHTNRIAAMGTTLTSAVVVGQTAFVAHIGDSRMYTLGKTSRRLKLETVDHSVVQRLVDTGQMSLEEAAESPQRSMLYKSLGQRGPIDPDVEIVSLSDVEYLLLCSDGLWDMVEDAQIEMILQQAVGPVEASAALINAANSAGGADNVTVVIARF